MKKISYIKTSEKSSVISLDIIKVLLITMIFNLLLIFIQAFVFNKWKIQQGSIRYVTLVIYYFSFIFCGFISGIKNISSGWKSGFIYSFFYIVTLMILGLIDGISFDFSDFIRIIISLVLGTVGGILGVNYTYSRKTRRNKRHK